MLDVFEMQKMKHISLALIGDQKVGKTTIVKLLNKEIESQGTTYQLSTGDILYTIWELQTSSFEPARIEVFSKSFLEASHPYYRFVIIVSDSSKEDVNKISFSLNYLRQIFQKTRLALIANKQDLEGRLPSKHIEKMVKVPTLGLSAIKQSHRNRLLNFVAYLIEEDTGI
jgi:signal recognition particle receptor subunit beta